jgi:hypothetical protein
MLFKETVAVYCESHTEHTNTLCGQKAEFLTLKHLRETELHCDSFSSYAQTLPGVE